jgi:hypothetical protein
VINLIMLQRDQRRHDQRRALDQHRGHLINRRLPRARRHHRQHVAASQHRCHRFELLGMQSFPTEQPVGNSLKLGASAHRAALPLILRQ